MTLATHLQHALSAAVMAAMLSACDGNSLLPTSGGTPYDVMVVDDSDGFVASCLQADAPGLPQGEPAFNVMTVQKDQLNGSLLLSRSIVTLEVDGQKYRRAMVRYSKNVHAEPQLMVRLCAPSMAALRQSRCMQTVMALLTRHEMSTAITRMSRKHNTSAEEEIRKRFGCTMTIPADMKINATGKGFLWLSDNATTGMRNICIYASENRDSVMKANLKGEHEDMYMTTKPHSTITTRTRRQGMPATIRRGLWEMKGDAMGGPYVAHSIKNPENGRTVVAEAFVYAPETRKRNLMRQTEAALYTLRFDSRQTPMAR